MKKIIFVICILFLTGCEAKYTLSYKDNLFSENISINNFYDDGNSEGEPGVNYYKNEPIYYDINYKNSFDVSVQKKFNDKYNMSFNALYDKVSIKDSRVLSECVEYFDYDEDDDTIYIAAYGEYYCYAYNKLSINFETDKNVTYTNSHKTKGGKYTWNYENGDQIDISIEIDKTNDKQIDFTFIYYLIGFVVVIVLGYFVYKVYKKFDENGRL